MKRKKTLENVDPDYKNPGGVEVYGDPGKWVTITKAWSKSEGWMKSTKAYNLGTGCLVQVSTQQGDHVAEALVFVPNCVIGKDSAGHPALIGYDRLQP